jgi:ankyrin repeat protein
MTSLEKLKRQAKALRRSYAAREASAIARVQAVFPDARDMNHADALHVLAREAGYASWPKLKFDAETKGAERSELIRLLEGALYYGRAWKADQLLRRDPSLGRATLGIACALYDAEFVEETLRDDPSAATRAIGLRSPLCHLAFSQHLHNGGATADMLRIAELLVEAGASVNDSFAFDGDETMPLSVLYGAMGHARNMVLAQWLLERGADPNDGESLYHATELGTTRGLELLLAHGARPEGTNVLPRALDFDDADMVRVLLEAGADPNEGIAQHISGEPPFVIPALHQAVRRRCSEEVIELLLTAGADPNARYDGVTPYALARVYGNAAATERLLAAGADPRLEAEEALLAEIADEKTPSRFVDPTRLPEEFRTLLHKVIAKPEGLDHVKRLVAAGLEWDRPDSMGMTPVMIAGWEGLPDAFAFMLRQKPDLSHVNGYGGTILGTIMHGSEHCPARGARDHLGCMRLLLEEGAALPDKAARFAGDANMAAFLEDWAQEHPGQVVAEAAF